MGLLISRDKHNRIVESNYDKVVAELELKRLRAQQGQQAAQQAAQHENRVKDLKEIKAVLITVTTILAITVSLEKLLPAIAVTIGILFIIAWVMMRGLWKRITIFKKHAIKES